MIYICGNGGSAAQADHFAAELIGSGMPCISLTNPAVMSALANDYGYEEVFAKQLKALAKPGDMLIALSTSGESLNIGKALWDAMPLGLVSILICGERVPQYIRRLAKVTIMLPGNTQEIQEATLMVLHEIWRGLCS